MSTFDADEAAHELEASPKEAADDEADEDRILTALLPLPTDGRSRTPQTMRNRSNG